MVRRSAPFLLGLVVCLFAVHPSGASPALRLDESRIRVTFEETQTRVSLEVESGAERTQPARVLVELLDPQDRVRAEAASEVELRHGANSLSLPLKLPYARLLESERKEFPWYRLRCRVEPAGGGESFSAAEAVVSLSEAAPELFELRVTSSEKTRPGSTLSARVRASNPVTGRPVKGVAVTGELKFEGGGVPKVVKADAVTGGDGFAALDFSVPRDVAGDDDGELTVDARLGVLAESAKGSVSFDSRARAILTTDKALYQPGQTMHARALVFDATERAVAGDPVTLKLTDENGETVFRAQAKTTRYGIATADWVIPESTKLGWYFLTIVSDDGREETAEGGSRGIRISRYDLPNFTVSTKPDRAFYLAGQSAVVEVRGDYLFGQPVKRGRVRVVRQTERNWDYAEQKYQVEEGQSVEGELDEQGRFVARIDLTEEQKELAESDYQRYEDLKYAAYVTDPTTNRTEQRRFSVRITKEPIHVYVNEGRYTQARGLPLAFYVSTSYADGRPAECEVTVIEEGATSFTWRAGEPRREVKEPDRTILKVRTNRFGVAKVLGPIVPRGDDRKSIDLRFHARDGAGRAGHHKEDFWLWRYYYGLETPDIRVETDKTIYREGEPVTVELSSDAERMSAFVDVSAGGRVVYSKPVRIAGGRASLVVPYSAEFRDAVTVSASSVEPFGKNNDDYAYGARAVVFPRNRELKLDVRMSRAQYKPGEEAAVQLAVRTASGRRTESALGVVVFDKAVEERARTEEEFSNAWGFGDVLYGFWYETWGVAGMSQRDVERLDLSRPLPEGLDAVAELLYNGWRFYGDRNVFAGTAFMRDRASVFNTLVTAELLPASDALKRRYDAAAEYPSDAASLSRMLSAAGVDFDALRDPWGQPFRAEFSVESETDVLEIKSAGPDERANTDDDFTAARFARPYFRRTGEAMNRAAAEYHARTGRYIRDLATLGQELRRLGVELSTLRDPWGQAYSFVFGVSGPNYTITVRSSGPNKSFEPPDTYRYATDDFTLWTTLNDYFAETRAKIDAALARELGEAGRFPADAAALREALRRRGVDFDALRDGWGHRPYVTFASEARYADNVTIKNRGGAAGDGVSDTRRVHKPVTQVVSSLSIRSADADARVGTTDDSTLAFFTRIATEQSARDSAARAVESATTFSDNTGAISGTVVDPNGAVIASARVTAKHRYTDLTHAATTNEEGVYLFRNLPSGLYDLSFEANGFLVAVVNEVQVQSSNLTTVDVTMQPGAMTETVTVTASGPASMDTTSASVSKTVVSGTGMRMPISTPRLRDYFPETLVWQPAVETDREGRAEVRFKLADNITTWRMSVIASTEDGRVGLSDSEFVSTQPFFVEHDPPRVLTEGDRVSLPVVLRNYLSRTQPVEVEMKPESWFSLEGPARQSASVPAGDAARSVFDFRAVASVKDGKQRVTALGSEASDAIEKVVTVHPDGEERAATDSAIIGGAGALDVRVPLDALRGSTRGELKVYPNLSAHLLEGVEAIMSRPYGCGEQTISSSYPSVLVLDYYKKTAGTLEGELPPAVARARRYARQGYERLLEYRAPGGGFTYWGHGEPDLALTAYALRFLSDASRVIEVDADVTKQTREWLVQKQRADGSWPALYWWGGVENLRQTPLTTAFIARTLAATRGAADSDAKTAPAESAQTPHVQGDAAKTSATADAQTPVTPSSQNSARNVPVALQKRDAFKKQDEPALPALPRALRYLASRAAEIDEPYLIASYALAAADSGDEEGAALAARKLVALAREEGAGSYWALETNTPFYGWGLAGRIETTALAVNALNRYCGLRNSDCGLKTDERQRDSHPPSNTKSEVRIPQLIDRGLLFLLRNKDRYGVWHSTQATVNVHDALAGLIAAGDDSRAGAGAAEIYVNGRRAGALELPPANKLTGPLLFDLSPFVSPGDNRVELRRTGPASRAHAQAVATFYVPWTKQPTQTDAADTATTPNGEARAKAGGGEAKSEAGGEAKAEAGGETLKRFGASALRLSVSYDRSSASVNQEIACSVVAERVGHEGYGMMLAEVGLPPGADVDRASLERTMKESGWSISSYDLLPDRLVVYLWPRGGGTSFTFKFRPRYGLDALTAASRLYDYYNPEANVVVAPTRFVVR